MLHKKIFLIFFLLITIQHTVYAQETIDMAIRSNATILKMDQELNEIYTGLYPALDKKDQTELKEEQRAWLTKRDHDFASLENHSDVVEKKDAYLLLESRYFARLQQLQDWIEKVKISGLIYVQNIGDIPIRKDKWIETTDQNADLQAFVLNSSTPSDFLNLEYMCHLQDVGDTAWVKEGELCGTTGRLEGFAIRLKGKASSYFTIKYQCYSQDKNDSKILADGEFCGTKGQSLALKGLKIWIEKH